MPQSRINFKGQHRRWLMALLAICVHGYISPWSVFAATSSNSKSPFADPVVNADALLRADKTLTWSFNHNQYLRVEGNVTIEVGSYGFRAERALVQIETEQSPGRLIHHLSIYLIDPRHMAGAGPVSAEGSRLLVTCSTDGAVQIQTNLMRRLTEPSGEKWVKDAMKRIATHHQSINRALGQVPDGGWDTQTVGKSPTAEEDPHEDQLPLEGVVIIDFSKKAIARPTDDGHVLILEGDVNVAFESEARNLALTLRAQNVVVFLHKQDDGQIRPSSITPRDVQGVYLEENVIISDGTYTVRAPRVYFEPATQRAVVLDAVFYTWDMRRQVPLYVHAKKLRMLSQKSFRADQAVLTTSEFAEPHFSIAVNKIRFDMEIPSDRNTAPKVRVAAKGITPKIGTTPIGWLPDFEGDAGRTSLRRLDLGRAESGTQVTTRWDVWSLVGLTQPQGVDLSAQLDYRGDHGPATGLNLQYNKPGMFGHADSYLVAHDDGKDEISNRELNHNGKMRGALRWQHRQELEKDWELSMELAYVSDATFLEEFERAEAETEKPYESSVYLKHQTEDLAFTFLAQYDLMNFTPQTPLWQAPGYGIEKLPEIGFYRIGTSLFNGRLSYFTENRYSRMRVRAGRDSPVDRGFNATETLATFGTRTVDPTDIDETVSTNNVDALIGVPRGYVNRLDTRHELQAPMRWGTLNVVPYGGGRVTFYDYDFSEFRGEDDEIRFWGIVGTRLGTSLSKTNDNVEDPILGLHRLRHVIEPNADLFLAVSSLNPEDIPIYDVDVENITEGGGARLGLRQRLQTQRGGPGRWRTLDWLVINTDLVLRTDDADTDTDPARFFPYRPELSRGGDHFYADLMWMLSDTFAVNADVTQSIEHHHLSQWHIGAMIVHGNHLSSYMEYADLDPIASRLIKAGLTYKLTSKYRIGASQRWDLNRNESRRSEVTIERKLPRWTLILVASNDDIDDFTSIGVALIPDGIGSSSTLGRFGQ